MPPPKGALTAQASPARPVSPLPPLLRRKRTLLLTKKSLGPPVVASPTGVPEVEVGASYSRSRPLGRTSLPSRIDYSQLTEVLNPMFDAVIRPLEDQERLLLSKQWRDLSPSRPSVPSTVGGRLQVFHKRWSFLFLAGPVGSWLRNGVRFSVKEDPPALARKPVNFRFSESALPDI